jgi:FtsP/CotA-like multicopper oxidase with cupredoxin domain
MADPKLPLNRRQIMTGLGVCALAPALTSTASAQGAASLKLQAQADAIALRPGGPETPIWSLGGTASDLRFKRGDAVEVVLENRLPVPALLNWRGIDGGPQAEPLLARPSIASGNNETLVISCRHAGTFMYDIRFLGDGQARPSSARALVVQENEAVSVDRDEVLLVEDWRLRADGAALAPGIDPKDATSHVTVNGKPSLDIKARVNERFRLRFVNGFQRNVIAIKIEGVDVRVMALDGEPAEPFLARNGAVVLAPGGRADVFIDATLPPGSVSQMLLHDGKEARPIARLMISNEPPRRAAPLPPAPPLPSNGLPARLDLKAALRVDLTLGGPTADWKPPSAFAASAAPAFRVKAGRTVVLALVNRGDKPQIFHLHGHHFRLLDAFDDGWKPFWLDTLAVEPGQTQRVAFASEYTGRWLIEAMATDWAAPRLVRWYGVE